MLDPYFMKKKNIRSFLKYIIWFVYEKSVLRNAKRICFTSKNELIKSCDIFNSKNNNNILVPYGLEINTKKYKKNFNKNRDLLNIIYLGRFSSKKNLSSLVKAIKLCLKDNIFVKVKMIGFDESKYSENLKQLINKLKLNKEIELIKYIQNDEKYLYLSNADFSIIPSFQENFCISAIESLALGVPIIISRDCDLSKDLNASGSAIISGTSPNSIFNSLKNASLIKKDKTSFKNMQMNALKTYQNNYSLKNSAEKIIKIFKDAKRH